MARPSNSKRRKRKYTPGKSTKRPGTGKFHDYAVTVRKMRWLGVEYPVHDTP